SGTEPSGSPWRATATTSRPLGSLLDATVGAVISRGGPSGGGGGGAGGFSAGGGAGAGALSVGGGRPAGGGRGGTPSITVRWVATRYLAATRVTSARVTAW